MRRTNLIPPICRLAASHPHLYRFGRSAWQTNQSNRCCAWIRCSCTAKVVEDGEHQRLLRYRHCKYQSQRRLHGTRICVDSIDESLECRWMHREKCRWIVFIAACSHELVELSWRNTLPKEIQTNQVRIRVFVAILCVGISLLQRNRTHECVRNAPLEKTRNILLRRFMHMLSSLKPKNPLYPTAMKFLTVDALKFA
jgi:hypothetical protein